MDGSMESSIDSYLECQEAKRDSSNDAENLLMLYLLMLYLLMLYLLILYPLDCSVKRAAHSDMPARSEDDRERGSDAAG